MIKSSAMPMKPLKSSLTAAIALSFAVQAGAATLQISNPSSANFGRAGGIYLTFSSTVASAAEANWGGAPPQDGQAYTIDSVTVVKNNGAGGASLSELWLGVYASYSGTAGSAGVYGEFLGVSGPVAWSTFGNGDSVTWTFDGVSSITAAPGQTVVLAFQTSADSLAGLAPVSVASEGGIALRRLTNPPAGTNNGGANDFANQGVAIIEATGGTSPTNGYVREDRVPFVTVQTTLIPEPSVALLGALGALSLLGTRRRH